MSEKMLVTQALDERDLLVKKIADKIMKASFVDTIKPNEERNKYETQNIHYCSNYRGNYTSRRVVFRRQISHTDSPRR